MRGTIFLGLGLAVVALCHCGHSQRITSDSVSLPEGSSGHTPCQQGLKVCQVTGRSCYVGSLGAKACWAQCEWITGPGGALLVTCQHPLWYSVQS